MAQNLLFIIFLLNFIILYNNYKISFRYQITEKYIIDAIYAFYAFYNHDYINLILIILLFEINVKTVY